MATDREKEMTTRTGFPAHEPRARFVPALHSWEREMERMFEDFPFFRWPRLAPLAGRVPRDLRLQVPALDLYEENNDVVVKAELPGMTNADIEITLADSILTIKGEKKKEEKVEQKDFYRCERETGAFQRSVDLPVEVKAEAAKATFNNGVLEIRIPKTEEAKHKPVKVTVQ